MMFNVEFSRTKTVPFYMRQKSEPPNTGLNRPDSHPPLFHRGGNSESQEVTGQALQQLSAATRSKGSASHLWVLFP